MVKQLFCSNEYFVDDRGFVISKRGKPLKPSINHSGYEIINLMIDGKRVGMAVHTAVARAFCDGYSPELQVNHKDGNKQNNAATNLEWVSCLENVKHAKDTLGFDNRGGNNVNARQIVGIHLKTGNQLYEFPSIIDAGRYFANGDEKRATYIRHIIWRVLRGIPGRITYRGCLWRYK